MGASIATAKGRKGPNSIARKQVARAHSTGPDLQQPYSFPASQTAYSFTPPVAGRWKFVGWAPGGSGSNTTSGGSGGYFEITRRVTPAHTIAITVGRQLLSDTSVVLPDGSTATATRGSGATAGAATGGDVNLAGTAGSGSGINGVAGLGTGGGAGGTLNGGNDGGAGAPANLPYRGGVGGNGGGASGPEGTGPGAGGGRTGSAAQVAGGAGFVLAIFLGD
jgi:hypothetical protein